MHATPLTDKLSWIHFSKPSEAELHELAERFFLHPLIHEELLAPSSRSRVETHDGYLFLIYHLPLYDHVNRTSRRAEIDVVATDDTLITVTYEDLEPIATFGRTVEKIPERNLASTAQLVYYLVESVNDFSLRQLRHVEEKLQQVGGALFRERSGKALLEDISRIKRDLLEFSLTAASERLMLESLLESGPRFWGEGYKIYLNDLWGDFLKIH
ncbi:MAG: CorA family divalent cation transporter, partial [Patescibacteria group bacterium]